MKLIFLMGLTAALAQGPSKSSQTPGWFQFLPKFQDVEQESPEPTPTPKPKPPASSRLECEKGAENESPFVKASDLDQCAATHSEIQSKFPKQYELMQGMNGAWSNVLLGDYEERVYLFQQEKPDNHWKNDQIKPKIDQVQLNLESTDSALKIQMQDFDLEGHLQRSAATSALLCKGSSGFYFKTEKTKIALKFKGPRCLWVALGNKWIPQRKFTDNPVDFLAPVSRKSYQEPIAPELAKPHPTAKSQDRFPGAK